MSTTGFSDNLKPDAWMLDLAWQVKELVSEPEQRRHFQARLDELYAKERSRVAGLSLWQREREQHLENAKSDERLQNLSAGPPPHHINELGQLRFTRDRRLQRAESGPRSRVNQVRSRVLGRRSRVCSDAIQTSAAPARVISPGPRTGL